VPLTELRFGCDRRLTFCCIETRLVERVVGGMPAVIKVNVSWHSCQLVHSFVDLVVFLDGSPKEFCSSSCVPAPRLIFFGHKVVHDLVAFDVGARAFREAVFKYFYPQEEGLFHLHRTGVLLHYNNETWLLRAQFTIYIADERALKDSCERGKAQRS
jgi:hypothetical protein